MAEKVVVAVTKRMVISSGDMAVLAMLEGRDFTHLSLAHWKQTHC